MSARELFLLSPYRLPGMSSMTLANEDMAAWMNAWSVLWHPALLWRAAAPPRVDVGYDHERPEPNRVYAVPESPPPMMPEDWELRVQAAGAIHLRATPDRATTFANLLRALPSASSGCDTAVSNPVSETAQTTEGLPPPLAEADSFLPALLDLPEEKVRPFLAIGLGYLLQATLSEAMEHENLLETSAFWDDVQNAIAELAGVPLSGTEPPASDNQVGEPPLDEGNPAPENLPMDGPPSDVESPPPPVDFEEFQPPSQDFPERTEYQNYGPEPAAADASTVAAPTEPVEPWRRHLQSAAGRLLSAREVLYPVTIYLIELWLLDEKKLDSPWPPTFERELPTNLIACSALLERWHREQPVRFSLLRERLEKERLEVCGGGYLEREDALLPVESQLWNIRKGQQVARALLGRKIDVYARKRFGSHPQLPLFLSSNGLPRALHLCFDDSAIPSYTATTISWPSPDGKQVDAFVRKPHAVDNPDTLFNLGHYLFKTIREDHTATLVFLHTGKRPQPWYEDFVELSRLGSIFGDWVTLNRYFNEVMPGEYATSPSIDEFHFDYLSERCPPCPTAAPGLAGTEASGSAPMGSGGEEPEFSSPLSPPAKSGAGRERRSLPSGPSSSLENPSPPTPLSAGGARGEENRGSSQIALSHGSCGSTTDSPVSGFARHLRLRRRIDATWTLAAIHRGLTGKAELAALETRLAEIEDRIESHAPNIPASGNEATKELAEIEKRVIEALVERLQARTERQEAGYLILNPCSFARRLALELDGAVHPLPIKDHVKACQIDGDGMKAVVEVPALGFCWLPRAGVPGTPPMPTRLRLADERCVRNEFFEAEIDAQTGGLRGLRDRRSGMGRIAQRLVFAPGSSMQASKITVTSTGPALGEIITEGTLLGEQQQVLAHFRQRFRAWLGRPVLEIHIELRPEQPPAGYPWHAYYGARFAWRDERSIVLRGINGTSYVSAHPRPQTPDFLELRAQRQSTILFPGGLPFLQRLDNRMVDVILVPPGETCPTFDLTLALDREHPMQTALGLCTPIPMLATTKGPPPVGPTGWLFHLDSPQLLLTGIRPGVLEWRDPDAPTPPPADAITVRLLECSASSGVAEFRCARDPKRATLLNAGGERLLELMTSGDAVQLEISPGDFVQVQVEFS